MWYEIVPFATIMFGCVLVTNYAAIPYNYFAHGRANANRYATSRFDQKWLLRDRRLNGDEYIAKGLETIEG